MTELFGSAWASQNGDNPSELWTKFLSTLPPKVIGDAIELIVSSGRTFPPHLPEFVHICQHAAGYPEPEQAYIDAAYSRWTHPVVYETCSRVGHFEVKNRPEKEVMPRWKTTYAQVCQEHLSGRRFDLPQRPALTKQPPKPSTPEHASRVLQGLLDQLGPDEPKKKPEIDPNFNDEYDWEGMLKFMGIPYTKHPDGTLTTPRIAGSKCGLSRFA